MAKVRAGPPHGPVFALLLIGADEKALPLLAHIALRIKIDGIGQFAGQGLDFRNAVGDQIHMLHRNNRQRHPCHRCYFPTPEPAGIDHHFTADLAPGRFHQPAALRQASCFGDRCVAMHLGPRQSRCFGIGVGDTGRIHMPVAGVIHRAKYAIRVQQRVQLQHLIHRQHARVDIEVY